MVSTHPPASCAEPRPQLDAVTVAARFGRREAALDRLAADAAAVACTGRAMAERFHRGGTLFVFGNGTAATDAAHVAVEFVHPAIVGKRALPAVALDADVATLTGVAGRVGFSEVFAHQLDLLARPDDIALGISPHGNCVNVLRALETGHARGLLTVAMVGGDGGAIATSPAVAHLLTAGSADPRVVKEVHVTMYHILWELVHVWFAQPATPATAAAVAPGALP